jgi:deoxyribodipyrimidine photo-lyase
MTTHQGTAIVWFRRDLRLVDHPALIEGSKHESLVCVYIDDPERDGEWPMGDASRWWLSRSLDNLDANLRRLGGCLEIHQGPTQSVLGKLIEDHRATAVYWNRLYEPDGVVADKALKVALASVASERSPLVKSFQAHVLKEPWEMLKKDGTPYLVFTPYWKHFQATWAPPQFLGAPERLNQPTTQSAEASIPAKDLSPKHPWTSKLSAYWAPGLDGAMDRLGAFCADGVDAYESLRNRPDHAGTSALSPYLHFGEVSVGQVIRAMEPAGEIPTGVGALSFVRELVWREFSHYLLFYFPHLSTKPLKPVFEEFPWRATRDYGADLKSWQRGQTGVPLVDAGMRQLWETGWMHNRVRMVVASYLTKNLLIPWQEGARHFWDTLVDADLANNTQGWQWTAGCGADASPYFRVFNPVLQGEKFDPNGEYVKHWCPELRALDKKAVHQPQVGIDLKAQRQQALDAYAKIKQR